MRPSALLIGTLAAQDLGLFFFLRLPPRELASSKSYSKPEWIMKLFDNQKSKKG